MLVEVWVKSETRGSGRGREEGGGERGAWSSDDGGGGGGGERAASSTAVTCSFTGTAAESENA